MGLDFYIFAFLLVFSAGTSITMGYLLLKKQVGYATREFSLFLLASAVWSLTFLLEISLPTLQLKMWAIRFEYFGIVSTPIFMMIAMIRFATGGARPTNREILLLLVIPALTLFFIWTNDFWQLMYQNIGIGGWGNINIVTKTRGPWYWVHIAYSYSAMLIGSFFIVFSFFKARQIYIVQLALLLIGTSLPWLANIVFVIEGKNFVDITTIAFALAGCIIAVALYRYKLFDLLPAAREVIIESMHDALIVLDEKWRIVDANLEANNLFGKRKIIGCVITDVLPPFLSVFKTPDNSEINRLEIEYDGKNLDLLISPIYNMQKQLGGRVLTIRDESARKLAETALKKREADLQELNAMKDKFFSIIAHDLKSPFHGIIGYSQLLSDDYDEIEESDRRKMIKDLREMSESGFKLLENLLQWARMQTGRIQFNPKVVDLRVITNDCFFGLNLAAEYKKITLVSAIPKGLKVFADGDMLLMILRNLISNGIKFTDLLGTITVSAEIKENNCVISVKDNGIGMKKQNSDKLFRIDSTLTTQGTAGEKGTGLGLILCKEFVEKHHGEIWVESTPDIGSTFYFTLPNLIE